MRGLSLTWGQMWFKSQCGFSRHHSFNVVHCTMLPIVQKHTNVSYTITRVMVFNTHSRAKDCNYRQRGLKIHKALVGRSETFWARVLIGPGAWPLLILALGIWVLLHFWRLLQKWFLTLTELEVLRISLRRKSKDPAGQEYLKDPIDHEGSKDHSSNQSFEGSTFGSRW